MRLRALGRAACPCATVCCMCAERVCRKRVQKACVNLFPLFHHAKSRKIQVGACNGRVSAVVTHAFMKVSRFGYGPRDTIVIFLPPPSVTELHRPLVASFHKNVEVPWKLNAI